LERLFAQDTQLARRLNVEHRRLVDANDRLWSGLHPDGLPAIYRHACGAVQLEPAFAAGSQVLQSTDPLAELQRAHWEIHEAHHRYQDIAEQRRHLAATIGEHVAAFVRALTVIGWSQEKARSANVGQIARGDPGQ
jgi:PAS domain-containing protein